MRTAGQKSRLHIVVADDDLDDLFLIHRAINDSGIPSDVVTASDGEELLQKLEQSEGSSSSESRPDIIFLDLNMPRLNGHEALLRIKADSRFKKIPIVVLSSASDSLEINTCYRQGANAFVTKPSSFDLLKDTMTKALGFWSMVSVLPG